jgi:amino acid transporter
MTEVIVPLVDPITGRLPQHTSLASNSIGVLGIVFFVVAAAAPLTVVVALFPVIIGSGNGVGSAGTFVLVALVLLVFSVGFVAMSRHITNTGAFYSYITKGLGRPLGLGAASLVIFSYNAIQLGLYGGIGFYLDEYIDRHFSVRLPWWLYSFAAITLCLLLGVRRLEAGARVLAVLLTLETAIIVALDVMIAVGSHGAPPGASTSAAGLLGAGTSSLSMMPFSPRAIFSGSLGVALMFAHASFIGFEGTAIYGEEARNPKKTVPRATYISVIFMGAFYAVTAWLIVNAIGVDQAVAVARSESGNLIFKVSNDVMGHWGTELFQALVITSLFAASLTFHSNVARYLFSLGRQGICWSGLGKTHPVQKSPYIACYVQTAMVSIVVAIFAVLGLSPYDTLFTWFTGIGAAGMIVVQCLASVAIFVYFRRSKADRRIWHTIVAPLLGIAGLLPFIYFALTSLDVLLGVKGVLQAVFMGMLVGSLLAGIAFAMFLKFRRPQRYARLDSSLGDRV